MCLPHRFFAARGAGAGPYDASPHPTTKKLLVWGASCAAFGAGVHTRKAGARGANGAGGGGAGPGDETGTFLAGSDGGPVFRCLMHHTPHMMTEWNQRAAGEEVPDMPSPVKSEYDPHSGAVHGITASPFNDQLFATCGADGELRLYTRYQTKHVLNLAPCAGALFSAQWSPHRPLVVAVGAATGQVVLYDLLEGGGDATQPTCTFRACDEGTAVQALAFNPTLREYLASADGKAVRVWELGARLTAARPGERRTLDRIAEAEGDAGAVLAAAGVGIQRRE